MIKRTRRRLRGGSALQRRSIWAWAALAGGTAACGGVSPPAGASADSETARPAPVPAPSTNVPPDRSPAPPAADETAPPTADKDDLLADLAGLPQEVLLGTDVEPLSAHLPPMGSARPPSSGRFRSEQGGAVSTLTLDAKGESITATRRFQEPGAAVQAKTYTALTSKAGGRRLSGSDVELLIGKEGVLLLEKASGVDGIPASLWIYYRSQKAP